jgi:hypothetical protein
MPQSKKLTQKVTKTLCTQNEANAFSLWNNNLGYQGILECRIETWNYGLLGSPAERVILCITRRKPGWCYALPRTTCTHSALRYGRGQDDEQNVIDILEVKSSMSFNTNFVLCSSHSNIPAHVCFRCTRRMTMACRCHTHSHDNWCVCIICFVNTVFKA